MRVVIGSENEAKYRAVKKFFPKTSVVKKRAGSGVSSKPLNYSVLEGAYNRANSLHLKDNDLGIGIEGGFFKVSSSEQYYLSDVCCIKDKYGYRFGFGYFYEITQNMYDYVKEGNSLNELICQLIEEKENASEFKRNNGIVYYITNGQCKRGEGNSRAVENALKAKRVETFNKEVYKKLPLKICVRYIMANENYFKLDEACKKALEKTKGE